MNDIKEAVRRIEGKIIHLDEEGWGFFSSDEVKYERIFFHWSALAKGEINFKFLRRGMRCTFDCVYIKSTQDGQPDKGWRALKIKVIDDVGDVETTGEGSLSGVDTDIDGGS